VTVDFFAAVHSPKVLIAQEFIAQSLCFALKKPSAPNRMLYLTPQLIDGKEDFGSPGRIRTYSLSVNSQQSVSIKSCRS